jgi:hypothetical protein
LAADLRRALGLPGLAGEALALTAVRARPENPVARATLTSRRRVRVG